MRSGIPSRCTRGMSPILPDTKRTGELPLRRWSVPRSQVRNSSTWAHAVVVARYSNEKYRQFVDDQENRLVVSGAIFNQFFTGTSPVSGTQPTAEPYTKMACADFFDISGDPPLHLAEGARDERTNRMGRFGDIRNHVLRAGSSMDIGEQEDPSLGLESPAEFLSHNGLAHTSLPGQQHVVAVTDA